MNETPRIGESVLLRDSDSNVYVTRVEDVGGDMLAVVRPADLRAGYEYDEGLELELVWTMPSGVHMVPVRLAGTAVDNHVRLWDLEITGDSRVEQRREYVRIPASGPVTLAVVEVPGRMPPASGEDNADGEDAADRARSTSPGTEADRWEPVTGTLIDISEAAAQCTVPHGGDDPRLTIGTRVRSEFTFFTERFDIPAELVIRRRGATDHETRIVIQFDDAGRTRGALRKALFAAQVEMRRAQRG